MDGCSRPSACLVPLYASYHPVTGDQLLTRSLEDAAQMELYRLSAAWLHVSPRATDRNLDRRHLSVPWARRFGTVPNWMTASSHHGGGKGHWSALGPEVPADLTASSPRCASRRATRFVVRRAQQTWRREDRLSSPARTRRGYGREIRPRLCRDSLQADPHPMNLVACLWHLTEANASCSSSRKSQPPPSSPDTVDSWRLATTAVLCPTGCQAA